MKKNIYLLLFFALLIPLRLDAACGGSSPTWTAASNSVSDITACITAATTGDTINVPTGTGSVTWASPVTINKAVSIIGPGKDVLTIYWSGSNAFVISLVAARISGFGFYTSAQQTAIDVTGQGWRIDHCKYTQDETTAVQNGIFVLPNGTNTTTEPYGLIDNNEIIHGKIVVYAAGNHANESAAWYNSLDLGTDKAIYVEDNIFTREATKGTNVIDSNRSGKYVFRYNTVTGTGGIMAHSLQDDNERGTRKWEIYGNVLNSTGSLSYAAIWQRAGTGLIFLNDTTSSTAWNYGILFDNVRSDGYDVLDNDNATGRCDGDSNYDMNDDATGWPCRDQIGRSTDASLWSLSSSLPGPDQASAPVYIWLNRNSGTLLNGNVKTTASAAHIKTNRDFYDDDTTNCAAGGAACSAGVGCGTLANRPESCTTGTAYWATDQSCASTTGFIGDIETYPTRTTIAGTLYNCASTDTWAEYFTPYSYPHPLRSEIAPPDSTNPSFSSAEVNAAGTSLTITFDETVIVNTNTGFALTPSGEAVTLTYVSGSGSPSLVYTVSRAILQGETLSLAYTEGVDLITDNATSSNELKSFSDKSVNNNSTQQSETTYDLTITKGSGVDYITTAPSGIDCGATCTATFNTGTAVTVVGSCNNGWGSVAYTGDSTDGAVTMSAAKAVTVTCTETKLNTFCR